MKKITLPLTEDVIESLSAGDAVLLSGQMFTSRDAGHKRLTAMINRGEPLPVDLKTQRYITWVRAPNSRGRS